MELKKNKNLRGKCLKSGKKQPRLVPRDLRFDAPCLLAVARELGWTPFSRRKHIADVVRGGGIHDLPAGFDIPRAAPRRMRTATAGLVCTVPILAVDAMTRHSACRNQKTTDLKPTLAGWQPNVIHLPSARTQAFFVCLTDTCGNFPGFHHCPTSPHSSNPLTNHDVYCIRTIYI